MTLKDQVISQTELLAGELEIPERELLRLLCGAAMNTLRVQMEAEPEECREDFVAAASLWALAEWYQSRKGAEFQEFRAGDLTVKQGQSNTVLSPESLKQQAIEMLRPYRKDSFRFLGV